MQGEPNYSGQIAYEIDKEVQRIVKEQYERCKQILLEHEEQLKLIAKTLLSEETLVAEQIQSLFYDGVLPEVDYDSAKVVKNENSDYSDGKYGKSYNDIRKEQLEDDDKEDDDNHEKDEVKPRQHRQKLIILHIRMNQVINNLRTSINHTILTIQIIDNSTSFSKSLFAHV